MLGLLIAVILAGNDAPPASAALVDDTAGAGTAALVPTLRQLPDSSVDLEDAVRFAGDDGIALRAAPSAAPSGAPAPSAAASSANPVPSPSIAAVVPTTVPTLAPSPAPTAAPTAAAPAAAETCPPDWFCYPRVDVRGAIVPYNDCAGGTDIGTAIRSFLCLSPQYLMGHAYTQFGRIAGWRAGDAVWAYGTRYVITGALIVRSCEPPPLPLAPLSMQTSLSPDACGPVLIVQAAPTR